VEPFVSLNRSAGSKRCSLDGNDWGFNLEREKKFGRLPSWDAWGGRQRLRLKTRRPKKTRMNRKGKESHSYSTFIVGIKEKPKEKKGQPYWEEDLPAQAKPLRSR